MDTTKLKKIERIVNVIDRGEAALLQYINDLDEQLSTLKGNIATKFDSTLQEIEFVTAKTTQDLEASSTSLASDIEILDKKITQLENIFPIVGADGKDGKDGKDGLNGKDGKNGRDGVNGLDGKDGITPDVQEVAIEASNLAYNQLKPQLLTLTQVSKFLKEKGISNYSDEIKTLQNRTQMLVQIASQRTNTSTSSSTPGVGGVETPSGTVDGSNTVFTVSNTPAYINVDGINKYLTVHYTYSAPTVTITDGSPPVLFIRSHY